MYCNSYYSIVSVQKIVMPEVLYEAVIEVEERVILHQKDCQLNLKGDIVQGKTGEQVHMMDYLVLLINCLIV